jgi:inositol transport system substrate-binding protein
MEENDMKKIIGLLVVIMFVVASLASCSTTSSEPAASTAAESAPAAESSAAAETGSASADAAAKNPGDITIGFSNITLTTDFLIDLQEGIEEKAKELGINVICVNPEMDANEQISQIESFISQKVDAIILDPCDSEASSPCVEKAQEAGIPVVNVNSICSSEPDAFVGSDDKQAAYLAIDALAKAIGGKGKIAMMHGNPGQSAEVLRSEGAMEQLKKYPDIELIAEDTAHWNRDEAMTLTENWIQAYGDELVGIFAQNDEMGIGVCNAIDNQGLTGKIQVVGVDLIADAKEYLADGRMAADIFQDSKGQGSKAVEIAYAMITGQPYEKTTYIDFQTVTKDNMDQYYK